MEELLQGFREFFTYKSRYRRSVNPTQAFCALRLYLHLIKTPGGGEGLTLQDLRTARDALLRPPTGAVDDHLELSKRLYHEIKQRVLLGREAGDTNTSSNDRAVAGEADPEDFKLFLTSLTGYGASKEAVLLLDQYWKRLQDEGAMYKGAKSLWLVVLRGLAKEGKEEELLQQAAKADAAGVEYMPPVHEAMTTFFAKRNDVVETKKWFEKPIYGKWSPTAATYSEILRFAIRNKQDEWLMPIFKELVDSNPHKAVWDIIFQWAVLALGKGIDDIRQLLDAMVRHNADKENVRPDNWTINGLVRAAIERKSPFLAEEFISLGSELGVSPDSRTFILQLDYRLDSKDLSGAQATFDQLQNTEIHDDEDLPVLNKFIRALCDADRPDVEQILDVSGAIEQRHLSLEPETVAALCMLFLKTDQHYEVIDILSLHTTHYSLEERGLVREAFVAYCLDKKNSTARVWDGYSLLRQFFPETEPTDRTQLMNAFFDRKRPDMACYIFGHMRSHANPSQRPTPEVYVHCLEGLGRCPDRDSAKMVHNMLKMDTTIQPDTKIYNALMIAYLSCDDASTAIDFWNDIANSAEGPSYNSLAIVFQICEALPFGDQRARKIWEKLQRMEVEVPPFVFWAYGGAIAGQGKVEEVKALIKGMEGDVGYPPDVMT
jgi:hypothetical protein